MKTSVVLLIFNRPDTTLQVFKVIQQVKPAKLLVIADGARPERREEFKKCLETRAVIDRVDWECEVLKNYSEVNLGCRERISSGLKWAFDMVEEAIILEDDCVPHPTFFPYCEELLDRYRNEERVMAISGQNVQLGHKRTDYSYYFSRYFHCWGWASWRRAWQYYDVHIKRWPEKSDSLSSILDDTRSSQYWMKIFQDVYYGTIDTWDYQWIFACWLQNGLTILPHVNLISNIGFGVEATHTTALASQNIYADMCTEPIKFPLKHPPQIVRNIAADRFTQNTLFDPSFLTRLKQKLRQLAASFQPFYKKFRKFVM